MYHCSIATKDDGSDRLRRFPKVEVFSSSSFPCCLLTIIMSRAARLTRTLRPIAGPSSVSCSVLYRSASTKLPQSPLPSPPDQPQENYADPATYTINYIGKTIKYLFLGAAGLGLSAYLAFEGTHMYIEHVALAPPSRATDDDIYAWADENQPWTGGVKGGTDPRLGWKGRHALRGAWICWEWGAGEGGAISKSPMIGVSNRIDRGYELAEEYIDSAIVTARARGIEFPPELPHIRESPPTSVARADETALDLLLLKAGILERIATPDSIAFAKDLYERVLGATAGGNDVREARVMRLAHKIGDLALRGGDLKEAEKWWYWGLGRAGVSVEASAPVVEKKGWFSKGKVETASPAAAPVALAPPVQRAATSILISASAAEAQKGTKASLASAAALQALAASNLPSPARPSVAASGDGPASLHRTWAESRGALLNLHSGSVAHAQKNDSALEQVSTATDRSEAVLSVLTPKLPAAFTAPNSNPCAQPAKRLLRDTLMTAAEAYFTRAALLERSAIVAAEKGDRADELHRLEHAGECYERAMSLSAAEEGQTTRNLGDEDAVGRTEEWLRYWRGYVRVRDRMVKAVEAGATKS